MTSLTTSLGIALLITSFTTYSVAHEADPTTDGWIGHVDGRQLNICYRTAPVPPLGTAVQILQASYVVPNKGLPHAQFAAIGQATVTAIAGPACVKAELDTGKAHWADHAHEVG